MTEENNLEAARLAARSLLTAAKETGAFSDVAGRLAVRQEMLRTFECSAFSPDKTVAALKLVNSGDREARIALHTALAHFMFMREPIPEVLQPYLLQLLQVGNTVPGKRGVSPHNDAARNEWICIAVKAVMEYGFHATRNPGTDNPSACSIVREELAAIGDYLEEGDKRHLGRSSHVRLINRNNLPFDHLRHGEPTCCINLVQRGQPCTTTTNS